MISLTGIRQILLNVPLWRVNGYGRPERLGRLSTLSSPLLLKQIILNKYFILTKRPLKNGIQICDAQISTLMRVEARESTHALISARVPFHRTGRGQLQLTNAWPKTLCAKSDTNSVWWFYIKDKTLSQHGLCAWCCRGGGGELSFKMVHYYHWDITQQQFSLLPVPSSSVVINYSSLHSTHSQLMTSPAGRAKSTKVWTGITRRLSERGKLRFDTVSGTTCTGRECWGSCTTAQSTPAQTKNIEMTY